MNKLVSNQNGLKGQPNSAQRQRPGPIQVKWRQRPERPTQFSPMSTPWADKSKMAAAA
jgi:hypothetical protein